MSFQFFLERVDCKTRPNSKGKIIPDFRTRKNLFCSPLFDLVFNLWWLIDAPSWVKPNIHGSIMIELVCHVFAKYLCSYFFEFIKAS